jgi:hypothetical protein
MDRPFDFRDDVCYSCLYERDGYCAADDIVEELYYRHMVPLMSEGRWDAQCAQYKRKAVLDCGK